MGEPRLPEVPPGPFDRHARLVIFALAAPFVVFVLAHLADGGHWLATDFSVDSDAAFCALATLLAIAVLLAVAVPLHAFLRLARHPAGAVRALSIAGALAIAVFLVSPSVVAAADDRWLLPGYALVVGALFALQRGAFARWRDAGRARGATLSVSVICKDEADRIGRMLEAVHGWADEIVVLDSGSGDGTVDVVRRYTDKVQVTDWPGFGVQKQRALERCTGEWVLSLDADEVPSEALKREIDQRIAAGPAEAGFKVLRGSVLFGGPVRFGADGDHHIRLFRRERTRFDGKPVHEDVIVAGAVGRLESPLWHFTFRDFAHLRAKFGEYAWLQARKRHAEGRRASALGAWLRGPVNFLLMYFWRLGLLDGRRGLLMAALYAHYTFDKYAALWTLGQATLKPGPRDR